MPIPSQTFSNITPQLLNYINTEVIPNGMQEIDGEALIFIAVSLSASRKLTDTTTYKFYYLVKQ